MLGGDSTDRKSFKKDFHDKCFESEVNEDLETGSIPTYVKYISDKKSIIEKFEKQRDLIDKGLKKISSDIDKMASKAIDDKVKNKANSSLEGNVENRNAYVGFDDDLLDEGWSSILEEAETETSPIVHKKSDGSYLVQSGNGDGYTAFNKDNVCQGHISASNETEAKNKFNSNKFDE